MPKPFPSPWPPKYPPIYQTPPRRRPPRWQFKWWLVLVPAALLFLLWIAQGVHPAGSWNDFMNLIRVPNKEGFTKVAVLGVIVTGIVALVRVLKRPRPP